MSAPVVIIGTGLAGYNLAREFRKLDSETPLLLITADDGRSYSKPMLSTGFGKNKDADGLSMATPGAMAEQLKAIGLNITIQSMDWPAIVALRSRPAGWHLLPGRLGTGPWLGDPLLSIGSFIGPTPGNHFKDEQLYDRITPPVEHD